MRSQPLIALFIWALSLTLFPSYSHAEGDADNPYSVSASTSPTERDLFFQRAVKLYTSASRGPHPLLPKSELGANVFAQIIAHAFGVAGWKITEYSAELSQIPALQDQSNVGFLIGIAAGAFIGYKLLMHPTITDVVKHLKTGEKKGYYIDRQQYKELIELMPAERCEAALSDLLRD